MYMLSCHLATRKRSIDPVLLRGCAATLTDYFPGSSAAYDTKERTIILMAEDSVMKEILKNYNKKTGVLKLYDFSETKI